LNSWRNAITCAFLLLGTAWSLAASADITVNTASLRLTFDDRGSLALAIACHPGCSGDDVRFKQFSEQAPVAFDARGAWRRSERSEEGYRVLQFDGPGGAAVAWRIPERGYRLGLEVRGAPALTLRSGEPFRPRPAAGFGNWLEQLRYLVVDGGSTRVFGLDDPDATEAGTGFRGWAGFRNRFWALLAAPPEVATARFLTAEGREDAEVVFDKPADGDWSLYLGPVDPGALRSSGLDGIMYAGLWFWLRWICMGLSFLLGWIHLLIPSWGLAIMALSLAVNILMWPLSRIADRLQQDVNETEAYLAPQLQRIKREFKGEEQAAKILALYKTERVHPLYSLKSLAGVAVVIPVFIGAFDMLAENIHLLNTGFLWITDLSTPDDLFDLPFTLPFFGSELNLLPFLMTGLSFIASWLHAPPALTPELRRKQVRNMLLLAVGFFALFYTFPAGMVLYWTTNNLISVIKSLWARR